MMKGEAAKELEDFGIQIPGFIGEMIQCPLNCR
jgi:hypothetical protein